MLSVTLCARARRAHALVMLSSCVRPRVPFGERWALTPRSARPAVARAARRPPPAPPPPRYAPPRYAPPRYAPPRLASARRRRGAAPTPHLQSRWLHGGYAAVTRWLHGGYTVVTRRGAAPTPHLQSRRLHGGYAAVTRRLHGGYTVVTRRLHGGYTAGGGSHSAPAISASTEDTCPLGGYTAVIRWLHGGYTEDTCPLGARRRSYGQRRWGVGTQDAPAPAARSDRSGATRGAGLATP